MFSTLSRRWFSLFAALLLVLSGLLPSSAAALTPHFSVGVKADCLGCALTEQFPLLRQQLEGEVPWTATTRRFGKRTVAGLAATAAADLQPPEGLKPLERQAWVAMAERGRMHLFLPQSYNGSTVVEQGAVQVQVQPLGAKSTRAEQQGKTLVYRNAYPSTDSLQVIKPGRSEEFLYLHNSTAPRVFDYQVRIGQGVQVRSEGGSIAFVDSRGRGVRVERPWLVDSSGRRSESAVHWQVLEGGRRLRLIVEPRGLLYPLVVDPTWSTTGSMTTPRYGHTATLLPNGKVLVAGGVGLTYDILGIRITLGSAELYDPQTGTWSLTGSMSRVRGAPTATLLPNGKVLVVGGTSDINDTSTELYDPQTGTWSITGSTNTFRSQHTATLLPNGKVLVAGSNSAELYDPQTGTWSTTGSMSSARFLHTATLLLNGKVLVAGGTSDINDTSTELYDPQTGTWSISSSMTTLRVNHTATLLLNGKVLAAGGTNDSGDSSTELYNDPPLDSWTGAGLMSTQRSNHTATLLLNGNVLVAGGYGGQNDLATAEVYDPQTDTWGTIPRMSAIRDGHTATLLPNGLVLVAGGDSADPSAEVYDPAVTISGFSPTSAAVGSTITITGSGFTGVTSVNINGISSSFGFISDNQLTVQVPLGATSGPITVTTPNGSTTSATSLTVLGTPPIISSFSPTSGPVGTTVTINGANFTDTTSVKFRTTPASFTVLSDSQIQAVVPAGATSGAIVVTTPAGSNTSPTKFTVTP